MLDMTTAIALALPLVVMVFVLVMRAMSLRPKGQLPFSLSESLAFVLLLLVAISAFITGSSFEKQTLVATSDYWIAGSFISGISALVVLIAITTRR